jgi:hypothetical protein
MVAHGSLLGDSVPGGSGSSAVGDGQGPYHRQDGLLPDDRRGSRLEIEDTEAQRLTIEEVGGPSAPKVQLNNLDRLVNWSNEFLGRRDNDQVYPVPINRNEQTARGSSTTVDMNGRGEQQRGSA